ncbi:MULTISPECIES: phosphoribosylanthranilate isomerase [Lysobacter]|uniref:phosphoribosylanthranilate isomerase n=1 Tax=Lysobacter TaxID=68 RepID=UPI0006F35071|nr:MULTISPECIES: phosphoribosylanthranilate isomerase [Lysobacter]KRB07246.1 N-(5'-phosphoribosyl)anthranilate isomerase [Lysobacter sp. Root690]MBW8808006.1 phosphoribosylanthranilate isomerase [Lysobacter sp.]QWF14994.1 phosphoribosylanthranilate isomerase [Lysobacter capsici]
MSQPRTLFRTRIKFCGFTRPGDVRLACELGADAIGFVFAAGSKRRVAPEEARAMRQALAPLVDAVALFSDNPVDEVREVVRQVRPSLLQFHGNEDDAFCRGFGVPYLKAIPMGGELADQHPSALHMRYPGAAGFLFDSHARGGSGGSGKTFDWKRIPVGVQKPFVLAGGITPDNVFEAILATLPWGVDVSSGIESAPGLKDGDKMRHFVEQVRKADCHVD